MNIQFAIGFIIDSYNYPKPYRTGSIIVHGLICCKNGCGYWNRDVNGATNIYTIAHLKRPSKDGRL